MAKFKSGDVVTLKSGGPLMTVDGYMGLVPGVETKTVRCKWFIGNKSENGNFHEDALKLGEGDNQTMSQRLTRT